jgi:hypothetical protein
MRALCQPPKAPPEGREVAIQADWGIHMKNYRIEALEASLRAFP